MISLPCPVLVIRPRTVLSGPYLLHPIRLHYFNDVIYPVTFADTSFSVTFRNRQDKTDEQATDQTTAHADA